MNRRADMMLETGIGIEFDFYEYECVRVCELL